MSEPTDLTTSLMALPDGDRIVWVGLLGTTAVLTPDQADEWATRLRVAATEGRRLLAAETSGR